MEYKYIDERESRVFPSGSACYEFKDLPETSEEYKELREEFSRFEAEYNEKEMAL